MTTLTRKTTAPLNLAAMVGALPAIILPNGSAHAPVFTAHAKTQYMAILHLIESLKRGETIDELETSELIDACLASVLPSATPDDLASLGMRTEHKLTVLAAAAGRLDEVLLALEAASGKAAAVDGSPASTPDTNSATP